MSVHDDLTNALVAGVLDFPAALDIPEIQEVSPSDVAPGQRYLWEKVVALHKDGGVSTTALVGLTNDKHYDLAYFNKLRRNYSDTTLDDLQGIAKTLKAMNAKAELREIASWIANTSANGHTPSDIAREAIEKISPYMELGNREAELIGDGLREDYIEIQERAKNPRDVWGIPYAWPRLSKITGGKQKGELILLAGEPKLGKSYMALQDAIFTAENGTKTAYISLEMRNKQLRHRALALCGVDGRNIKTGYMGENDWQALTAAMGRLEKLPLYMDDRPVSLEKLRSVMTTLRGKGVEHFIIDYAYQVQTKGRDEIERTEKVSSETKRITLDLDVSTMLIASVNKAGMDKGGDNVVKSNIRGSGQQIHDADVIYVLTKYSGDRALEMGIQPRDYWKYLMLHISAGRELTHHVEGGYLLYSREDGTPALDEMKE